MNALEGVVTTLQDVGIPFAVIGATGMAAQGVLRSTLDVDLLTTDERVLNGRLWTSLVEAGLEVEVRHGDISDPLVGVVVVSGKDGRPVDIIVGEAPWQARIVSEATPGLVAGMELPIASMEGLILLKLYAGGPQDRWDIEQLLHRAEEPDTLRRLVSDRVLELPPRARRLWEELSAV